MIRAPYSTQTDYSDGSIRNKQSSKRLTMHIHQLGQQKLGVKFSVLGNPSHSNGLKNMATEIEIKFSVLSSPSHSNGSTIPYCKPRPKIYRSESKYDE